MTLLELEIKVREMEKRWKDQLEKHWEYRTRVYGSLVRLEGKLDKLLRSEHRAKVQDLNIEFPEALRSIGMDPPQREP